MFLQIIDRALSAKSISPQEKQRLIQIALTMDAPKIARQLISEEEAATVAVQAPSKQSKAAAQSKAKNKKYETHLHTYSILYILDVFYTILYWHETL